MTRAISQRNKDGAVANFMLKLSQCKTVEGVDRAFDRFNLQWPEHSIHFQRLAQQVREALGGMRRP